MNKENKLIAVEVKTLDSIIENADYIINTLQDLMDKRETYLTDLNNCIEKLDDISKITLEFRKNA